MYRPSLRGRSFPRGPISAPTFVLAAMLIVGGSVPMHPVGAQPTSTGGDEAPAGGAPTTSPIRGFAPAPGAEGISPRAPIEVRLAVEPLFDASTVPVRVSGSLSGPRTDSELSVDVRSSEESETHAVQITTSRPYLPGEVVQVISRGTWLLADGRHAPTFFLSFRVGPRVLAVAGLDEVSAGVPADMLFEEAQHVDVSAGPNGVVAADFDGNGAVDLAVSDVLGDNGVHVLWNDGAGRLRTGTTLPIEGVVAPGRLAVGDVNDDGRLDLVVVGQKSNNLVVLEGREDGRFSARPAIDLPADTPIQAGIVDLDLDGNRDLLVSYLGSEWISLLRGDPDAEGGLGQAQPLRGLPSAHAFAIGDLDGNWLPDVALVSEDTDMIGVLLGMRTPGGPGELAPSFAIPSGHRPQSVVAGDLDADGHTDLVTTHQGSNDVAILLGRGDGTFRSPRLEPVGDRPTLPALADLDSDGYLDLAVPNLFSDDVTLLFGAGDGSFRAIETLPVGAGPVAVAATDIDNDGDIDLAVVHSVSDDVTIYRNRSVERGILPAATEPRSLSQNVPNPFNPHTTIHFTVTHAGHVNLVVFNTNGKVVRSLVDETLPPGEHTAFWDGTDGAGINLPSGIYFYRLTTDETVELRRMTLLR